MPPMNTSGASSPMDMEFLSLNDRQSIIILSIPSLSFTFMSNPGHIIIIRGGPSLCKFNFKFIPCADEPATFSPRSGHISIIIIQQRPLVPWRIHLASNAL